MRSHFREVVIRRAMDIAVADWVEHSAQRASGRSQRQAIFSIDVAPDGQRFATGGKGAFSGLVLFAGDTRGRRADQTAKVWNMRALADDAEPRLLCTLTSHTGPVNCVKWSR